MPIKISVKHCKNSSLGEIYHPRVWNVDEQHETYVDVGAYNGYTTRETLLAYPQLTAVAIEPLKTNFKAMKKTLLDIKDDVHMVNKGCWHLKGSLPLLFRRDRLAGSTLIKENATSFHKETEIVKVDTLDNILGSVGILHVDFLKIDTEGAEHNVLMGLTTTGDTRFHIEYHYNLGQVLEQLLIKNASDIEINVGKGGFGGSITGNI
jgi:FkbM family methyltransferase